MTAGSDIAPPEPGLTFGEMLSRAEALRATLRDRQQLCEQIGRVPDDTHRDFLKAGFYRVVQPRRFGGYGFCATDFVRLVMEVSRGCVDTGWVLSLLASAQVSFLTPFPEQTLREAYGRDGDCRTASVLKPGASAIPAEGGYRVGGAWDYCSGCDVATHLMGTVVVRDAPGQPPKGIGFALFDRSEFEIEDNWDVFGMRGTGSRRVAVKERTLPAHRVVPMTADLQKRDGSANGAGPAGVSDANPAVGLAAAAVAAGAARGALDLYENILRTRKFIAPPFPFRFEMPEMQQHFGDAQALVDAAEASLLSLSDRSGEFRRQASDKAIPLPAEDVRRMLRAGGQSIDLAWQAVDLMFRTGGTSSAANQSPLGRVFRGLAVLRTHVGLQLDHSSINVARLHFGLPALDPL